MTYPLSSAVSAGQPTAVGHYNNLRADAIWFGQSALDSLTVPGALVLYDDRIQLERYSTNRIRLLATASRPVTLMIDGCALHVSSDLDLSTGAAPSGVAAQYYLFAVRTSGSYLFTLDASTSSAEGGGKRRIGKFYWSGTVIEPDTIMTEEREQSIQNLHYLPEMVFEGRLTLTTNLPVPTADQVNQVTLYFTPYKGDRITMYEPGLGWNIVCFTQCYITLAGLPGDTVYDVFGVVISGVLTLELLEWTSPTARTTLLATVNGVKVLSGDASRLYLGTICTVHAGGKTDDSNARRLVWNNFNRILRQLYVVEASWWAYSTATWRPLNNDVVNRVEVVTGVAGSLLHLEASISTNSDVVNAFGIGIGMNRTNDADDTITLNAKGGGYQSTFAALQYYPSVGYNYYQVVEKGAGSGTQDWYASSACGIAGFIDA